MGRLNLKCNWIQLFLFFYAKFASSENDELQININISHLISMYIPVCGSNGICMPSSFVEDIPHVFSSCADCSCGDLCFFESEPCCFEPYFQSKYVHCRDFTLLVSNNHSMQSFNYVIDACPSNADKELAQNCSREYSIEERMKDPPVVNPDTRISYKNSYCALCHDIKETVNWHIEFVCLKQQDFNYFSSYEEFLLAAEEAACNVIYTSRFASKCGVIDNMVTKCNVSGTWKDYDIDIEKACHSEYINSYQMYKNVFCAMCNPPLQSDNFQQKKCTTFFENEMSKACDNIPETMLTYPFRNIFCKFCHHDIVFGMIAYFQPRYLKNSSKPFEYRLHNTFMMQTILENIKNEKDRSDIRVIGSMFNHLQINFTKLIMLSKAAFAENTCDSNIFPSFPGHSNNSCSCHIGCTKSCCDDHALKQPLSCINDDFPPQTSTTLGYYVLNECPKTDLTLYSLCTSQNTTDDLTFQIPVTHLYSGRYVSYRNVYCMIGNTFMSKLSRKEFQDEIVFNTFPWIVIISCPKPATIDWFDIASFLQYTRDLNCTQSLQPNAKTHICEYKPANIEKCNVTGTWRVFDADILNACENIESFRFPILYDNALNITYRNKFCKICNPQFIPYGKSTIAECDSDWPMADTNNSELCFSLPEMHVCSMYKNAACEICNEVERCDYEYSKEENVDSLIEEEISQVIKSYRSIFALSSFDSINENQQKCSKLEFFLQNTCRNVECFPGKTFENKTCVPLINRASNLRYAIYLRMEAILDQRIRVRDLLNTVEIWFSSKIANILQLDLNSIQFENATFLTWNSCNSFVTSIFILSRVTIFLPLTLTNRQQSEVDFIKFADSVSASNFLGIESKIYTELDTESEIIDPENDREMCKNVRESNNTDGTNFRLVIMNNLLTCPLVTLNNDEFVIESPNKIRLISSNTVLSFQHFRISDNGSYQTCIRNTFIQPISFTSDIFSPLSYLTGICTMLSVVCLFFTFLTYSLFDSLRTIPGINSMNLVANLLFLQLLILTRKYHFIAVTGLKVLLFTLTHYLLLCVFFWLNVCSYHMYRVFTDQFLRISGGDKLKTVLKYVVYAYVLPLLFVFGNVTYFFMDSKSLKFGYGENETLVDDKMAYIVTFIVPLSIICLTNIVFFSATAYKIKSTPKIKGQDQSRLHFVVCIKLFALTGLSWVLQIVDSFFELSILSYIVAVLNGLQGFLLFLSYVCNARVWRMYKNLWVSYFSGPLRGFSTDSTKL